MGSSKAGSKAGSSKAGSKADRPSQGLSSQHPCSPPDSQAISLQVIVKTHTEMELFAPASTDSRWLSEVALWAYVQLFRLCGSQGSRPSVRRKAAASAMCSCRAPMLLRRCLTHAEAGASAHLHPPGLV